MRPFTRNSARSGLTQRGKIIGKTELSKLIGNHAGFYGRRGISHEPAKQQRERYGVEKEDDGKLQEQRGKQSGSRAAVPGPGINVS